MNKTVKIIVGLIVVATLFYGGVLYGKKHPASSQAMAVRTGQFGSQGIRGGRGLQAGGGVVFGDVLSRDAQSITVKTRDGGSKLVFIATSTSFSKVVKSSVSDVYVGMRVSVSGTANTDGSVTANSIQETPATTTPVR